jgi:hypothetical protein
MANDNRSVVDKAQDYQNPSRSKDKGFVNEQTGSSVLVRENGDITLTSSEMAQYKLSHDTSTVTEVSLQSNTITNRKSITTDEILINNHKLNNQLYSLADIKELVSNSKIIMGDFAVTSSVLVKAWEPNLGRYVLIRRPARTPMFSTTVNIPEVPEQFGISNINVAEELKKIKNEIANSNAGE